MKKYLAWLIILIVAVCLFIINQLNKFREANDKEKRCPGALLCDEYLAGCCESWCQFYPPPG